MRVKRGVTARRRHKKLIKEVKGYQKVFRSSPRLARQAIIKAQSYAYRDRRNRKRDLRQLWITRINAAAREHDLTYGQLMASLKAAGIELDRKILAELAANHPAAFKAVVEAAKKTPKPSADAEAKA
jgi:large subunit ribosomal protein L20